MQGRERKDDGKPCVTSVTIILLEKPSVEEHKTSMLREFPTKHPGKSPVTFVRLKRFAVLFFLPSRWVNH